MFRREHRQLGFMQLAIICGFSIFYASYLLSFFGLFAFFPAQCSFLERRAAQILLFAGAIVGSIAFLAVCRKRNRDGLHFGAWMHVLNLVLASSVPVCAVLDVLGCEMPFAVVCMASFAGGIAVASGFSVWEGLSARGHFRRGLFVHGIAFAAGGGIFLACMVCLPSLSCAVVCELFLALSVMLALFIAPRSEEPEPEPVESTAAFFRRVVHLDIVTYIVNAAFGFAFVLLYQLGTVYLLVAMALAVLVNLCVTLCIGRDRVLPFVGAIRITMAFVTTALVCYACPSDVLKLVGLGVIVSFWFVFRTVNAGSLAEMSLRNGFSSLYANIRGKLSSNVGFAIGIALGMGAVTIGTGGQASRYVALALVAASVLSALFLLPFENESDAPGFRTLSLVSVGGAGDGARAGKSTAEKCALLVRRYKLSQREAEVLAYAVKGRNARHVAERLCITESTAKTHFANIYRKVNVHSQQELLDLIDLL